MHVLVVYMWRMPPLHQVVLIAASLLQRFSFAPPPLASTTGALRDKHGDASSGESVGSIDLEPVYGQTMHPQAYAVLVTDRHTR